MKNCLHLALFVICGTAAAQTTVTYQPDAATGKDAVLHGLPSVAGTNYGANEQLPATTWTFSGNEGTVRGVIEFTQLSSIPTGATVNSAYLSLYAHDGSTGFGTHSTMSGSNACWLERVTDPWDESTVTFNSQPATTATNRISIAQSTSPTQDYVNIDVTQLVQDMVTDPANSHGFLLKLQTEAYYRRMNFCSSDYSDPNKRPKLQVTYTVSGAGIDESAMNNNFKVFPNPAEDLITVVMPENGSVKSVVITDNYGRTVNNITVTGSTIQVDIYTLPAGIYWLSDMENTTTPQQFVKVD